MTRTEYINEDGSVRPYEFEDSDLYEYFIGNELLCIFFEEPEKEFTRDPITGRRQEVRHPLIMNKFLGFKRLVFSDMLIETSVRACWEDTRSKIMNNTLVDVFQQRKDGSTVFLKSGKVSSAPNFIKSSQNDVFIHGSAKNASCKTECVNGIRMLPQYIWLKGGAIIDELYMRRCEQ